MSDRRIPVFYFTGDADQIVHSAEVLKWETLICNIV